VWVSGNPQSAACEGRGYLRFFSALWFIIRTIWTSQTYDVIDYYFPFNTILSTVWWCPCYVTDVYVNNWSWHVHGSHSVCLLKTGCDTYTWTDSMARFWTCGSIVSTVCSVSVSAQYCCYLELWLISMHYLNYGLPNICDSTLVLYSLVHGCCQRTFFM
jgi:hypothetical protein